MAEDVSYHIFHLVRMLEVIPNHAVQSYHLLNLFGQVGG